MTYNFVFIRWKDIMADDNHWAVHEDCVDWAENINDVVEQAGVLLEVEAEYVVLADMINRGVSDSLCIFSGITKIPRQNIIEISEITGLTPIELD